MGYFSCNEKSAIAICDSYNWELLSKDRKNVRRPFKIAKFDYSDLLAATGGFSAANLLGKGSHGSVYKAYLHQLKVVAAVKKTKANYSSSDGGGYADNEVEILSRIYHPRLVNLIGFAVDPNQHKLIVAEYMPHGSLFDLLHGPRRPPGWVKRARFALQVARAVHFLHSSQPPVIHRDIKSSNVLIDAGYNSRVSDFGLALRGHVEDVRVRSTPPAGTLGYLDPGYLAPGDLSTKSDVFSFGILLLEIISGRNAIDVNYSPPSVVEWALPEIKSGNLEAICDPRIGPPDDAEALRLMAVLAARCVRCAAEKRPGMAEVAECLKGVYGRVKARRQACINVGRRVAKYEPLEDERAVEVAAPARNGRGGSRRNGKVSSATSVGVRGDVIGDRVGRSKSIGTASEIKFVPLDLSGGGRRGGFGAKMSTVRLSKSKSMGIIRSKRLIVGSNAIAAGSTKSEESKLLVDLVENVGGEDKEC